MSETENLENNVEYKIAVPIGIPSNSPSLVSDIVIYPNNYVIDVTLTLNDDILWEQKNIRDTSLIPLKEITHLWVKETKLVAWYGQTYIRYKIKDASNAGKFDKVSVCYNMSNLTDLMY